MNHKLEPRLLDSIDCWNINNLRNADDTILRAETEEELKSFLMNVKKESEKAGLKLNIQKTKIMASCPISSVQFSCSVMSNSLRPHELQHTRLPCPSPTPRVHPNPCPSSRWCHPAISSSVVSFSSCLQSFPASGSFQMSQFFASGSQSFRVSASASVLPMNIQDWFLLGWTGWISFQSKGLSRFFSKTQSRSINSLVLSFLYSQLLHPYMTTGQTIALTRWTLGKVTSLLFNMLSRFVITFLPGSKRLLMSWLQSPSAVNLHSD